MLVLTRKTDGRTDVYHQYITLSIVADSNLANNLLGN